MSELERALDRSFKGWDDPNNIYHPDVVTVAAAARRFASLTSPETIGVIAAATVLSPTRTEVVVWLDREYAAELVRSGDKVAVLRSVEEGET